MFSSHFLNHCDAFFPFCLLFSGSPFVGIVGPLGWSNCISYFFSITLSILHSRIEFLELLFRVTSLVFSDVYSVMFILE